jgi:hypothetical protein
MEGATKQDKHQKNATARGSAVEQLVSDFYLIAGNNQQSRDYCDAKGIEYDPRGIIHTPRALRGKRNLIVRLVGTWQWRKDWVEMEMLLKTQECQLQYDDY